MLTHYGLRRSDRLMLAIPITISGKDAAGEVFTEPSRTLVIGKHGGLIAASRKLASGSVIAIRNPALTRLARARVVSVSNTCNGEAAFEVGVEVSSAAALWPVAFPHRNGAEADAERAAARARKVLDFPSSCAGAPEELQESLERKLAEFQERSLLQLELRLQQELEKQLGMVAEALEHQTEDFGRRLLQNFETGARNSMKSLQQECEALLDSLHHRLAEAAGLWDADNNAACEKDSFVLSQFSSHANS